MRCFAPKSGPQKVQSAASEKKLSILINRDVYNGLSLVNGE